MDTQKVTKANAPFWMANALVLATIFGLMMQLSISGILAPQSPPGMGMMLAAVTSMSVVRMLILALKSPLSEPSNPIVDSAFKAKPQAQGEPNEFTLPEPLVL
ncbi:hypothetical protein FHJ31_18315 [Pseudomonas sp. Fig-3]|uniref:hypothetical protein n=1 Tax=unclassified Pseudomonas TaxID=196821 RepID=UPI0010D01817|nr:MULTISPECIES: hypothetical protein [unclassified Pseudomonas]TNB81486.1 hypothetical protein FHJ31_18315 [Pseudomonas sp. Fig-3]VII91601.1 hypothetical protein [Pseudomonas sp. FG-3G]